jgi:hypothetical protein
VLTPVAKEVNNEYSTLIINKLLYI